MADAENEIRRDKELIQDKAIRFSRGGYPLTGKPQNRYEGGGLKFYSILKK